MRAIRYFTLLIGSWLFLAACGESAKPSFPTEAPPEGSPNATIYSTDGYYTLEELPESQQPWVSYGAGMVPLTESAAAYCPDPYPEPGDIATPLRMWYTVTHIAGSPIQRLFTFPLPYRLWSADMANDKLFCSYSNNGATSDDNEWELTGGILVAHSTIYKIPVINFVGGVIKAIRYDNGIATRISCEGEELFDPEQPCDDQPYSPPTGGGSSGGGSSSGCYQDWIIVEINYNDGTGWHELWSGWATVCG